MSMRKKRVVVMTGLAMGVVLIFFIAFTVLWRKNEEENKARYKAMEGVWTNDEGDFTMTVRRVTGGHMLFSIESGTKGFSQAVAQSVDGDGYEFAYSGTVLWYNNKYNIQRQGDMTGRITLGEGVLSVEMPAVEGRKGALEFQGELKKKESLQEYICHLGEYMGTDKDVPKFLKKCCLFERGKDGRVARIYVSWNRKDDLENFYGCDLMGVSKRCFENDCEANFGEPEAEEEFVDGRKRNLYQKDGYIYAVCFGKNGLVSSVDCRKSDAFEGTFRGDFLCQGNTILRYMGDFATAREIKLPEGTDRIAAGAFAIDVVQLYEDEVLENKLSIPASVVVEPGAFEHCGRWRLDLQEGWTVIPADTFANMCSLEEIQKAMEFRNFDHWVKVILPRTVKRLEDRAFFVQEGEYQDVYEMSVEIPVEISMEEEIEYIGNNALAGITIDHLPEKVKYVGSGVCVKKMELPGEIEELGDQALQVSDKEIIISGVAAGDQGWKLPGSLRKIGESAFGSDFFPFSIDRGSPYFSCENGALWSKDKSELYYFSKPDGDVKNKNSLLKRRQGKFECVIPEGTKVLHKNSLDCLMGEFEEVTSVTFPRSLEKMHRDLLLWWFPGFRDEPVIFKGNAPEFYGDMDEQNDIDDVYDYLIKTQAVRVKASVRDTFIRKLFEGQQDRISKKVRKIIEKNIKGY